MNLGLDNVSVTMSMDDEQSVCWGEVVWEDVPYKTILNNSYRVYPGYPTVGNIYNNGLSVADLILLQKHLNNNPAFSNNWDKVSTDADGDGDVDQDDLDLLSDLNIGHISSLSVNAFQFIHYDNLSSFEGDSLSNAFSKIITSYNQETFFGPALGSLSKWYFHGLKIGDFNETNSYYRDLNFEI